MYYKKCPESRPFFDALDVEGRQGTWLKRCVAQMYIDKFNAVMRGEGTRTKQATPIYLKQRRGAPLPQVLTMLIMHTLLLYCSQCSQ